VRLVDANEPRTVVDAMKGHDVAASTLGPFYRYEVPLVRAALEAGVDYASICDEWNPMEQVLDELDEPSRRAGCTVVIGLGTSPGITNVGIRHFASRMDRVDKAEVSVYQPLDAGGGEAVFRHMLFIMSGEVVTWRDGRRQLVPACSEVRHVEFPRFGTLPVWNMGHGEPATVPRFIDGLDEVGFYMGYGRGARPLVASARAGLFASERGKDLAVKLVTPLERLGRDRPPGEGAVRIDVWGEKDGRAVHELACGVGTMREATALSLVVGALALGRRDGLTRTDGVFAPEACFEPGPFIVALRELGVEAFRDIAMTEPLVG
jgi:saccharopine dehydrogenase (NAD+, L-lysine-forming)